MFHPNLTRFINDAILPLTSLDAAAFWKGFDDLINEFSSSTRDLLADRLDLQAQIDHWHDANPSFSQTDYEQFLLSIGYLLPQIPDFVINTDKVDAEIATLSGPQLVVPLKNARFALNAANARWGSLYDALYGSDIIVDEPGQPRQPGYDSVRGNKVIAYARAFLDSAVPLASASHAEAVSYCINDGLVIELKDGHQTRLRDATQFAGYLGDSDAPSSVLFKHHGLHIECVINRGGNIGSEDAAGIDDIILEAALTTIMDCEDSVAAVDAEDKIDVYKNWLGLMTNTLSASFVKGGATLTRSLNQDREFLDPNGAPIMLRGRSLLFNRNVGHLMTSELAHDNAGEQVPEHIIDAVMTALIGAIDLASDAGYGNSCTGSLYIVKPKMHGPVEVAFTCRLFASIEVLLSLPANTIKLGIMDEERRTSVNLKHCIFEARERLVFINTGFLDRTGDEIYTSMNAGVFPPKAQIKDREWINAYENRNVEIGLACGLQGRAQIGKGMWAMPDEMAAMMKAKVAHPQSGASTAWVPSPTAAVLHAMHYHAVDVRAAQESVRLRAPSTLSALLTIPLLGHETPLDTQSIERELENNIQGILGYVVRWIESGIGCSKVPDIHNIGLMEDRATLRISAVHVSNWLKHGLCNTEQVIEIMQRMAKVVDEQNANDPLYRPMADDFEASAGFAAAKALIFDNPTLPNGYTEPLLHAHRVMYKASQP
ncbi:malate synthase G [Gammaproteobacteria bacterium]|jgi:malate synthase|nr:malate synthase G [Gammaproteobacteria bacterium]MDA7782343.1 malate synthase G [Gammaproteobacteria bacterium]MDB2505658.1 malate synthase G [Gammaproteobacteria bacterium]MDB4003930.1 malate synthase G [Gammaproteobacteria bacterium]MDB4137503.1 malate synthase G [Gammaproteobacteria bacterium]